MGRRGVPAAFALVASYIIWYTAVQQLGGSHTAIYSNVVPIVAMVVASLVLGEPTTSEKLIRTAAVSLAWRSRG